MHPKYHEGELGVLSEEGEVSASLTFSKELSTCPSSFSFSTPPNRSLQIHKMTVSSHMHLQNEMSTVIGIYKVNIVQT